MVLGEMIFVFGAIIFGFVIIGILLLQLKYTNDMLLTLRSTERLISDDFAAIEYGLAQDELYDMGDNLKN